MLRHIRHLAAVVVFASAVYAHVQPVFADPNEEYPYGCYIDTEPFCAWGNYLTNALFRGCLENEAVWSACWSANLFCAEWCADHAAQEWYDSWDGGYAQNCTPENSGSGPGHMGECVCAGQPDLCDGYCYEYYNEPYFCSVR